MYRFENHSKTNHCSCDGSCVLVSYHQKFTHLFFHSSIPLFRAFAEVRRSLQLNTIATKQHTVTKYTNTKIKSRTFFMAVTNFTTSSSAIFFHTTQHGLSFKTVSCIHPVRPSFNHPPVGQISQSAQHFVDGLATLEFTRVASHIPNDTFIIQSFTSHALTQSSMKILKSNVPRNALQSLSMSCH